jgi:hypothetical protein
MIIAVKRPEEYSEADADLRYELQQLKKAIQDKLDD